MTEMAIPDTLSEFIEKFEAEFGYLLMDQHNKKPAFYTRYFQVFTDKDKKKFSDWDFRCWLTPGGPTAEDIKKIDKFVNTFERFKEVGVLLTFSGRFKESYWHPSKLTWLHFMGFMPSETNAPFFDLHVENLDEHLLSEVYRGKNDNDFLNFMMITGWRKRRNGNNSFVKTHIIPLFPEKEQEIIKNPNKFFDSNLPHDHFPLSIKYLTSAE